MTEEVFDKIILRPESSTLDFKLVPHVLNFEGMTETVKNDAIAEFLKDISSFVNTPRGKDEMSYIIYGIRESSDKTLDLVGINDRITKDQIDSLLKLLNPIPIYEYEEFTYNSKIYGIISLPVYPYKNICTIINDIASFKTTQVWLRNSSSKSEATPDEINQINNWLSEIREDIKSGEIKRITNITQIGEKNINIEGDIDNLTIT